MPTAHQPVYTLGHDGESRAEWEVILRWSDVRAHLLLARIIHVENGCVAVAACVERSGTGDMREEQLSDDGVDLGDMI